ncbi:MAG: hypothetical protein EOP83_05615 [Verrucomicrobiaceae bacterium]|nr:MAG: hypothetical protein EOP83_05615 [Verrucomicrobiaceae bacterium]
MKRIIRTATVFSSYEEAEAAQQAQDEALTPEERLQTTYELSVLAYGPPSRLERVHRVVERTRG